MTASTGSLESRLFSSYWDDGLLDILAGAALLGISACWLMDLVAVGAAVPAIVAPLWIALRRRVVEPRVGMVEFSETRHKRTRRLFVGTAALGVALLVLFTGVHLLKGSSGQWLLVNAAPAIPAVLLALLSALAGWGLGIPRFLGYSTALCIAGLAVSAADARPEVAMMSGSFLMLGVGAWRLLRFLRLPIEPEDTTVYGVEETPGGR
jgi:hypothetical protein